MELKKVYGTYYVFNRDSPIQQPLYNSFAILVHFIDEIHE